MEFCFNEVGVCDFTIKELHHIFCPVDFDISFYEILTVF